jgi:hypothetical protein
MVAVVVVVWMSSGGARDFLLVGWSSVVVIVVAAVTVCIIVVVGIFVGIALILTSGDAIFRAHVCLTADFFVDNIDGHYALGRICHSFVMLDSPRLTNATFSNSC